MGSSVKLTIGRALLVSAKRFPDAVAIEDGDDTLTYSQLADRIERLGGMIKSELGLSRGDCIALMVFNCPQYIEIVVGLAQQGIVVATLSPLLSESELEHILVDCNPRFAILDIETEKYAPVFVGANISFLVLGDAYEAALSRNLRVEADVTVGDDDCFCVSYTSGTTGKPKGVMLSHRSRTLLSSACQIEYGCFGMGQRFLAMAPMFHGAGFAFSLAAVSHGGSAVLHHDQSGSGIAKRLAQGDIDGVFMVPTHFKRLFDLPRDVLKDLGKRHRLQTIISNAAALSAEFKVQAVACFGDGLLHETYGSTEVGIVTNIRPNELLRFPTSVGKEFVGMDIQICRSDRTVCTAGEVGELFARGPYNFLGYLNKPDATRDAFDQQWISVGDLATRDAQGNISIVGRAKDMVISGGVNIYPIEIETVIAELDDVAEVAVIGVPDVEWGEAVVAIVVPRIDHSIKNDQVVAHCRNHLSRQKTPKHVYFIEELPRNASGKLLKNLLRERFSPLQQDRQAS